MSTDPTEIQGGLERRRAIDMSLKRGRPPTQVPGYEPERLLGVGAYGEVWVALEQNTRRKVAIKFYAHRGGLDWSLLSREVEKLAFLFADRYVVQLLGVGWDADPPYYVMEYLEKGSLADRIAQGPLPVAEAVALFRDVATGLVHAHGKGVLHCDLKPANVLLDQDGKPRLADFGQSRLSTEQAPALGTMFYMAPEQADLDAMPDARWDVYALGALLYCMLTGGPPYRTGKTVGEFERTPELTDRLVRYRRSIEQSPPPDEHRKRRGVDKMLAAIVDRCLAVDPNRRFANVQAVLDALDARDRHLARRPMMVLGAVGPALLLAVVTWFAWMGFSGAVRQSNEALTRRALEAEGFAARYAARTTAYELERRFQAVEQLAQNPEWRRGLASALAQPDLQELLSQLSRPYLPAEESARLREQFLAHPARAAIQADLAERIPEAMRPGGPNGIAAWFFCDARGVQTIRVPDTVGATIGANFAWRGYFHGGGADRDDVAWRPEPDDHIQTTTLSDVYLSRANGEWMVAISSPVFDDSLEKKFLGILAITIEVGRFVELRGQENEYAQFAVLVNHREGKNKGVVLQHPLFDKLLRAQSNLPMNRRRLPDRVKEYRIKADDLPDAPDRREHYRDPLAVDPEGGEFAGRWLARMEPVLLAGRDVGWIVIVQEAYDRSIGQTLDELRRDLIRSATIALALITLLMAGLWGMAERLNVK